MSGKWPIVGRYFEHYRYTYITKETEIHKTMTVRGTCTCNLEKLCRTFTKINIKLNLCFHFKYPQTITLMVSFERAVKNEI